MNYGELKTAIQDYCQNSEAGFVSHIPDFVRAAEDKVFLSVQMPSFWKSDSSVETAEGVAEYEMAAGVVDILSVRISEAPLAVKGSVDGGPSRHLIRKDYDFLLEAYPGFVPTAGDPTVNVPQTGIPKYYSVSKSDKFSAPTAVTVTGTSVLGSLVISGIAGSISSVSAGDTVVGTGWPSGTRVASKGADSITCSLAATAASTGSIAISQRTSVSATIRLGPIPDDSYVSTVDYYGKIYGDSITVSDGTETWLSITSPDTLLYGSLAEAYIYMKGEPDLIQTYSSQFTNGLSMLKNMGEGRLTVDSFSSGPKRIDPQ